MEISSLLQELASHRTEELPAYGHQEPLRWVADVAVMEAFESGVLDLPDFYFTGDDYHYRLETDAKRRFLGLLREEFNSGVSYKGRVLKWDTVIEQKAVELGSYLVGRSTKPDFSEPAPRLTVMDDRELRRRILSMTLSDAKKLGIEKSTLHNLRGRAQNRRSLKIYAPVRKRLAWKEN